MKQQINFLSIAGYGRCKVKGAFNTGDCYVELTDGAWLKVKNLGDIIKNCTDVKWLE